MCLIHFQLHDHPHYKLIVAANRDEFYGRPTAGAHFWKDSPSVLAGRDLQQMGTWLGITKQGRFAALTNFRQFPEAGKKFISRGMIVRKYLEGKADPKSYFAELHEHYDWYDGFNIIAGGPDTLWYYSNREKKIKEITDGVHSLSNHLLDTPWPKTVRGKQELAAYTEANEIVRPDHLFEILLHAEEAPDEQLPDNGIDRELEKKLSASFIKMPDYGTRAATVLLIDKENHVTFAERTYNQTGYAGEKSFQFQIE